MPPTTREALITAAAELLDGGGPAAVTLRAVALKVGVSHNAPYKHFADKEALLAAVAARELRGRRDAAPPAGDPVAALKAMALAYVRWALKYPARFKLTFGGWSVANPELGAAAETARGLWVDAVRAAQGAGLAAGDPERVTALILALCNGAADQALSGHLSREGKGAADPEDLVEDLFALMTAGRGA